MHNMNDRYEYAQLSTIWSNGLQGIFEPVSEDWMKFQRGENMTEEVSMQAVTGLSAEIFSLVFWSAIRNGIGANWNKSS